MTTATAVTDTASLVRHRPFVCYWLARVSTAGAYQMMAVAIGWQVYDLSGSALALGFVGLAQFIPMICLTLIVGTVADRYDRRAVIRTTQIGKALCAATLAAASIGGFISEPLLFIVVFFFGICRTFETPTMHTLVPGIVPLAMLPRAIAASQTANQTAIITGPAIGGFLYLAGPGVVYGTCTAIFIGASILIGMVQLIRLPQEPRKVTLETVFAGFHYMLKNRIVLGAISLDLFAVLLGGVTAILPIYARDILHTGPEGLGILRAAPAIGALSVSVFLARNSLREHVGLIMFGAVIMFGLSILVFGLSTSMWLSVAALAVYGATDAVSVVIRHSLVQTRTPDEMLGRVMAVNSLFTGTSGSLGEFESGAAAAAFGPVVSAVIGGVGAITAAIIWMVIFPELRRVQRVMPEEET
jgi:MFS family permease